MFNNYQLEMKFKKIILKLIKLRNLKKLKKIINRKKVTFETDNKCINFQQFETIRSFTKSIFNGRITLNHADEDRGNLSVEMLNFD